MFVFTIVCVICSNDQTFYMHCTLVVLTCTVLFSRTSDVEDDYELRTTNCELRTTNYHVSDIWHGTVSTLARQDVRSLYNT